MLLPHGVQGGGVSSSEVFEVTRADWPKAEAQDTGQGVHAKAEDKSSHYVYGLRLRTSRQTLRYFTLPKSKCCQQSRNSPKSFTHFARKKRRAVGTGSIWISQSHHLQSPVFLQMVFRGLFRKKESHLPHRAFIRTLCWRSRVVTVMTMYRIGSEH